MGKVKAPKPPGHRVYWSKRENALLYHQDGTVGDQTASSSTGGMLALAFEGVDIGYGRSLAAELESRGYDLTTLRFCIRKKPLPRDTIAAPVCAQPSKGMKP
jgi:hypothetical protein